MRDYLKTLSVILSEAKNLVCECVIVSIRGPDASLRSA